MIVTPDYGYTSFVSGIVWVIVLVGVLAFGLAVFRHSGERKVGSKHGYFYIMSFLALVALYWAFADIGRLVLSKMMDKLPYYLASNYTRDFSLRISTIIVALPIFVFHWAGANPKDKEKIDHEGRRTFSMAVMILAGTVTLIGGTRLVYETVNSVLGVVTTSPLEMILPYVLPAAVLWVWNYKIWKSVAI